MDEKKSDDLASPNKDPESPEGQGATGGSVIHGSPLGIPTARSSPYVAISGIASSPPQFVTMEQIMSTANGLKNMQLFHEIAVDQDFKLAPYEPPENSLEKVVKDAVHRAFWDLLAEELSEDPPVYTRAMILLEEVKEILLDLLLPHHVKLKQEIDEMIDIPFIQQQAENGALDFLGYAQHIINVMGRICAPVRDGKIQELKEMTDPIQIFKGVFETLTLMRVDFANCSIQMVRSKLMAQSVDYEKSKFADALSLQGGIESLVRTKKWLKRHMEATASAAEKDIILSAYLELFEWNPAEEFPETVLMDSIRHKELGLRVQQLIVSGSVLLVTLSRAGSAALPQNSSFKEKLLHDVGIILQDAKDDEGLKLVLPNVAVQVINVLKMFVNQGDKADPGQPSILIDSAFEQSLAELIQDIYRPDHNVRRIVKQRTTEFLHLALSSLPNVPKQVPPGMTSLQSELLSTTGSIIRLYTYNLAVFGEYYSQIIAKLKEESASTLQTQTPLEPTNES